MPPKRTPASTAHGPPSPTPLDDHPEPSPSIGEPTLAEYNDLATALRDALRRINELEANADSSHTSLGPQEQLREPRVEPPPEFSGSISEFPNFIVRLYPRVYPLSDYVFHRRTQSSLRRLSPPWNSNELGS